DDNVIRDGMDIALCSLRFDVLGSRLNSPQTSNMEHETTAVLQYAGANNSLYVVRNGELLETKADKQPIGAYETDKSFQNHEIELQKGDMVYLFSDGFADQFGGPKGKKFNYKQFKQLLIDVSALPVDEQQKVLFENHNEWKGSQ